MRESGIKVITNNKAAQSVLDRENGKTPLTGQPNRANEKPTSGSVLASIRRDSSSNPTTSKQASAKVKNDTQSAKNKIKKYFNGDFLISKTNVNKAFADFGKMFAMRDKGGSRYSILQTNSGKTIAIRISNHTAKGDNFKQDNADSNLSIVIEQYKYDNASDSNIEYTEATIPYEVYLTKPTEVIDAIVNGVNDTLADKEFSLSSELGTVEKKGGEQANTGNKKVRFFRTANGEAYGFTVDGKIYIDPTIAGAETAIHEYTHLWATALKNANPKEWSNIVSLMKGTPIWEKVASEYPELKTDDELADEVLAHYSGKRGAERLRKEAESIANGKGTLLDKAGAISALERVKEALTRFWKATADLLHIHFTTAEEVADKVLADLLNGVNPNEVAKDKNTRFSLRNKPVGGNSGYVGYSMSKRAERARENGRSGEDTKNPTWEEITDALESTSTNHTEVPGFKMHSSKSDNTKVSNNEDIAKDLEELSEGFNNNYAFSAKEFIGQLALRFNIQANSENTSYKQIQTPNGKITVRLGNHQGNAINFILKNSNNNINYGIVIKLANTPFKEEKNVNYLELVYFGDIVKGNSELQKSITLGLSNFVRTGSIKGMPKPNLLNPSGSFKKKLKEIGINRKLESDNNLYRTSEEIEARQSSPTAIVDSVMSLAERLHLGNVEIVTDTSALSGKEARAKKKYKKPR